MFLAALSFAYFAKALSGSYMKSTITQLERRFDIPSYLIGIIDGSFEIGEFLRLFLYISAFIGCICLFSIYCIFMILMLQRECLKVEMGDKAYS